MYEGETAVYPVPDVMPAWTRPIRIPEEVEVTHPKPSYAIAGEASTWRVPFKLCRDVPPGSDLKLQVWGGRNNRKKFYGIQVDNPEAPGFISARMEDGSQLPLESSGLDGTYLIPVPERGLQKGEQLVVLLGNPAKAGGVRACRHRVLNKPLILYVDPGETKVQRWTDFSTWNEQTQQSIVASSTLHVLGGVPRSIRVYVPATVRPGEVFPVLVRPEDEFGNLAHKAVRQITVRLNGSPLSVETERVPGSTCLRGTTALNVEGVHRLTMRCGEMDLEAVSNPLICSVEGRQAYWGMIHGHTEMSDGTGSIDRYFRQMRDETLLDFAASSDHDHPWETPDEYWKIICEAVKRWNDPPEFVTLLGYEWAEWRRNGDGDRNVYYLEGDRPIYRADDDHYPSPPDLFTALRRNDEHALVIPHHTAHGGNFCDWKDHDPRYERLVEIFAVTGGYECAEEDGNPVPPRGLSRPIYADGYVRKALAQGWRVGFTAGGDDHCGHWGSEFRFDNGYKQGLMCVEAEALTREAIFAAMANRRVTATTGARMLLTYQLSGSPMGAELSIAGRPELASSRQLVIRFHGTAPVDRLDVVRNHDVVHSVAGRGASDLCVTWEDQEPLSKIWLPPAEHCDHRFAFYYVRVMQKDGEVAWASPTWIDP